MSLSKFMKNQYGKWFYLQLLSLSLLTFCSFGAQFLVTYDLGQIIDSVSSDYQETLRYFRIIAAALLLSIVTSALRSICSGRMTARFACRLKQNIGSQICKVPCQYIESFTDGELLTMVTKDVEGCRNWLALCAKTGCLPAQIGLPVLFVFQYDWRFALFTLCLLPLAALPEALLASRLHRYHAREKKAYSRVLSFFNTMVDSSLVLKSFQLESLFQCRNQVLLDAYKKERMSRSLQEQLVDVYSRIFGHVTNVLILLLGAFFILTGNMTLGKLTSIILLANFVGEGIKVLNEIPVGYQGARASLAHLETLLLLEREPTGKKQKSASPLPDDGSPQCSAISHTMPDACHTVPAPVYEVKSLRFSYGNRQVLHDVTFAVAQGEKIAIVGPSGCGKSTLFKVLSGLYTPGEDQVFFLGRDVAQIPPDDLRTRITATTQETFLFQATFRENICMADTGCTDTALIQAARNACIHDLIAASSQGYDTPVCTTTQTLSGGQAQRLNLARAFLRDTDIWLLDEPTSALDADTTDQVLDHLFATCGNRTLLMILHNMQEIHRFDKVLLLVEGKVAGFGTHAALLTECEAYRRLYAGGTAQEGDTL